jgi:hypothetical protein
VLVPQNSMLLGDRAYPRMKRDPVNSAEPAGTHELILEVVHSGVAGRDQH